MKIVINNKEVSYNTAVKIAKLCGDSTVLYRIYGRRLKYEIQGWTTKAMLVDLQKYCEDIDEDNNLDK